jgi:hypothetical protein
VENLLGKAFRRRKALLRFLRALTTRVSRVRRESGDNGQIKFRCILFRVVRGADFHAVKIFHPDCRSPLVVVREKPIGGLDRRHSLNLSGGIIEAGMVGRPGFEPGTNCLKGNCSTIELPAPFPKRRGKMGFRSRGLQEISPFVLCCHH